MRKLLALLATTLCGCSMLPTPMGDHLDSTAAALKMLPPGFHGHEVTKISEKYCILDGNVTDRIGLSDTVLKQALDKGGDYVENAHFAYEGNMCMVLTGNLMALDNGAVATTSSEMDGELNPATYNSEPDREIASVDRIFEVADVQGPNVEVVQRRPDRPLEAKKTYNVIDSMGHKRGTVQIERVDGGYGWGSIKSGKAFWGWSLSQP